MKKLLILIASLLLAGTAYGQPLSGKGLVDNIAEADARCDAATVGYRIYDLTSAREETCDGTNFVPSGGTAPVVSGSPADLNFIDTGDLGTVDLEGVIRVDCGTPDDCDMRFYVEEATTVTEALRIDVAGDGINTLLNISVVPTYSFRDTSDAGTSTTEGSIAVNCDTPDDCDMDIGVQTGGTMEEAIYIEGVAADDYDIYLGRGTTTPADYVRITEGGLIYQYSDAPYIYFHDTNEAGGPDATNEASIGVGCPAEDNCDMEFMVESGAGNYIVPLKIDTVGAATSVMLGIEGDGNYLNVSEAGRMDTVGTALIMAPHDHVQICGDLDTINNNIVFYGPNTTMVADTNGFTCDITNAGQAGALGGAEEIAQDELVYSNQAVQVTGMTCRTEKDTGMSISFTLRSDAAATVPSVTCTIDGTGGLVEQDCVADIQTTTGIGAASTLAIAAASAGAPGAVEGFICNIQITY